MADHCSLRSQTQDLKEPILSSIVSPRLFRGCMKKGTESEAVVSPTSILDTKSFYNSTPGKRYGCDQNHTPKTFSADKHPWEYLGCRGIGLALITSHNDDENPVENLSKPQTRMVMFGQKLKVQIPPLPPTKLCPEPPKSPDFGIKTRNTTLLGSPSNSAIQTQINSPQVHLSVTDMELSEDYTCVISHGPNPRTTHIFDNCIVGSCHGSVGSPAPRKECCLVKENLNCYPSESYLNFCYTCKKNLGHEKDIYIYRGEKAFCSQACRSQEIMLDGMEN